MNLFFIIILSIWSRYCSVTFSSNDMKNFAPFLMNASASLSDFRP